MNKEDTEAKNLRAALDHLLERFRADTIFERGQDAHALILQVRHALEEEFVILLSQYSEEALQKAVLIIFDESKRLPIHLACDRNATFPILQTLLQADTEKKSIVVPDKWGDLCLHTACSRHQTDVVKLLLDSDISGKTLFTKADNGSLPLHAAVRFGAPASVVTLLLESNESRSTLLEPGPYSQLAIHAACRIGAHPDVIDLLLKYDEDKKTLLHEDNVGRLPIHLALLHSTENQLEVVRLLLEGMLYNRMENKGIYLWKNHMKRLLKSMETHERDFTTRDKLDMICETIRDFMERVFALEMAVWRASCLQFDTRFSSMQEVLDHESAIATSPFDAREYKSARRIRSGADIILRDVIPFLENDPVDDLMQKFRDY